MNWTNLWLTIAMWLLLFGSVAIAFCVGGVVYLWLYHEWAYNTIASGFLAAGLISLPIGMLIWDKNGGDSCG